LIVSYVLLGGWNFLACEDCEKIKKKIIKEKCPARKRYLKDVVLEEHYAFQEKHRFHYAKVS
jgi:hypothetical protein